MGDMTSNKRAPRAEKRPFTRTHHGIEYVDNYQWMRDDKDPDVLEHVKAENAWHDERTAHLADLREKLVKEFASHTKEDDVSAPVRKGDYWYWTRTWEGKSYPGYYRTPVTDPNVRPDPETAPATKVYDGNELAEGKDFFSIGVRSISPDGKLCALGVDNSGDEYFRVRIYDVDSDTTMDEAIEGVGYGFGWSSDATRVYYTKMDDAWRTYQVWCHKVGTDASEDELIFQEDDELYSVGIEMSGDDKWLTIHSASRTTTEVRLVPVDSPSDAFVVCERTKDLDYQVQVAGEDLLIIHNGNNVGFELASAPLAPSRPEEWVSVYSAADGERLTEVLAFKDWAVLNMRHGGAMQIRAFERDGSADSGWGKGRVIETEELSTIFLNGNAVWDAREVGFTIESILTPETYQIWNLDTGKITTIKTTEVPNYDREKFVQYRDWATAEDGTKIPLSIAHLADLERGADNPGFIEGYGSYEISNDAWFSPMLLSMLERGVVVVIAHIRGGGEMGRTWYDDGKVLNKKNTFTDFVASARHVIDTGLVGEGRLAAEGGSAGGLLMGAVANLAPETFAAIHANVPFVDALTTILDPSMPLTVGEWEEWGNPLESKEVYEYMASYSPTENVREVEYPAILASTSVNDIRVSFTEPAKWVQVLRDHATNDEIERPILQYTELAGGHGGGSGKYKRWESRARHYSFMLDRIGAA